MLTSDPSLTDPRQSASSSACAPHPVGTCGKPKRRLYAYLNRKRPYVYETSRNRNAMVRAIRKSNKRRTASLNGYMNSYRQRGPWSSLPQLRRDITLRRRFQHLWQTLDCTSLVAVQRHESQYSECIQTTGIPISCRMVHLICYSMHQLLKSFLSTQRLAP